MMEAEKWYQYQESYQKYGFDMKPKQPRQPRRQIRQRPVVSAKDKARLLFLLVVVGILCVGLIITTAYAASVKYDTNQIVKENNALSAEIENLDVKVYSINNIEAIEKKATKEQKMVYPASKQIVYLAGEDVPKDGFAEQLKKQAYNEKGEIK